jgi:hypothetical protein
VSIDAPSRARLCRSPLAPVKGFGDLLILAAERREVGIGDSPRPSIADGLGANETEAEPSGVIDQFSLSSSTE